MLASTQMYVNTTLYRNSRISRLYCGKTIKDRGLLFGMVPTHILKAKTAKFQVLTPFGSLFFRYPIFKVYTIVYNSAGRFSTPLKTFSSRRVFRPFIEQGASPPPPGGVFFPGCACQRCNYKQKNKNGYFVEIKFRVTSNNQKWITCHDQCIIILITI